MEWAQYFPANAWLARLLEGWRLPPVVGLPGRHGVHSIMLVRSDEP